MKSFAFVFPGQGSQSPGMLNAWGDHPVVRHTLTEASDALAEDLSVLIRDGSKESLALTTNTQPVMLVAAVAAYRVWQAEVGIEPGVLAGHSLGEYSALVASGAMSLAEAAPLVRFRAQAMQDAVPVGQGAMAAVLGLDAAAVIASCKQAMQAFEPCALEVVEAVNFNDPLQTVIAGSKSAVNKACEILKANGAKRTVLLPVSAPFHSRLMQPAADRLREKLAAVEINPPLIPVVNNIDAVVEYDIEHIRDALYRQAFGPVRWVECVRAIKAFGIASVVECGPGKVLAGLVRRIDPDMAGLAIFDPASLMATREQLA